MRSVEKVKEKSEGCRNARSLCDIGLHWRVPFIEDLSETVQVVW